jgi:hypothetical protein
MEYVTPSGFYTSFTQSQLIFHPFGIRCAKRGKKFLKQRAFLAARGGKSEKKEEALHHHSLYVIHHWPITPAVLYSFL